MTSTATDIPAGAPARREPAPAWAQWLFDKTDWLITDLGGGPRTLRVDQAVNFQKFITIGYIYLLMMRLGEIMIYWSYALLVAHWIGWLVVAGQLVFLFLPRMLVKDASLSRHPGWSEYKKRSGLIVPWRIVSLRAVFDR